jgi:hypothetical protein
VWESLSSVNHVLHHELEQIWIEVLLDHAVNAIALTAAGRAFCAGATSGNGGQKPGRAQRQERKNAMTRSDCGILFSLAPITSATQSLKIGLVGIPALADWYQMIDLQIGRTLASATATAIAYQHRHTHAVLDMNSCGSVLVARLVGADVADEWPEPFEFHRLACFNQGLQLVRMNGPNVFQDTSGADHSAVNASVSREQDGECGTFPRRFVTEFTKFAHLSRKNLIGSFA